MRRIYQIPYNCPASYKEPREDTSSSSYDEKPTYFSLFLRKKIFKDKASTIAYCGNWKHRLLDTT